MALPVQEQEQLHVYCRARVAAALDERGNVFARDEVDGDILMFVTSAVADLADSVRANQRISVDDALRVYTWNGAYNSHEEHLKGSIAAGKLADFVVLSDDPHSVDPAKINAIEIVRTVTGGRTTYAA
jgi:predicted amidohydrolase YtcJ